MVENGRTMAEARAAGTWFRLDAPEVGDYEPPACETPGEVLACFRKRWPHLAAPGRVFRVWRHLPASRIGCAVIEDAGTVTA